MKKFKPLSKVLVIGQGDLAKRQRPTYEHWLANGVKVHCADINPDKLENSVAGLHTYVLPQDEKAMLNKAPFDLLYVANIPSYHLKTTLQYGDCARQIIIQKPLHPGLVTLEHVRQLGNLYPKIVVHDHYRNKSSFAALLNHGHQNEIRRMLFFLTETKSVTSEIDRAGALTCGVLLDLGVHMLSLLLDCIKIFASDLAPWELKNNFTDQKQVLNTYAKLNEFSLIEISNSYGAQEIGCGLGKGVETLAVLDLTVKGVTDMVTEKFGVCRKNLDTSHGNAIGSENMIPIDVLIVTGKGIGGTRRASELRHASQGDLKAVVLEFADGRTVAADLSSLAVFGLSSNDVNTQHGGLNRPLLLLSPNPPEHALYGLGGQGYSQWQSFSEAALVCKIAHQAKQLLPKNLNTYPTGMNIQEYLKQLVLSGELRPIWKDIGNPYRFKIPLSPPMRKYYD